MALESILLLGDPRLYETCAPVQEDELTEVHRFTNIMQEAILSFRQEYGHGRAIAAPQVGYMKQLIYAFPEDPLVIINPALDQMSEEMIELWDDCMSFPNLRVRVRRHQHCRLTFLDSGWKKQEMFLENELSELIQHEYDHLDGILAIQRAVNHKAFTWVTKENQ